MNLEICCLKRRRIGAEERSACSFSFLACCRCFETRARTVSEGVRSQRASGGNPRLALLTPNEFFGLGIGDASIRYLL